MTEINWRNSEARHAAYGPARNLTWMDVPPTEPVIDFTEGYGYREERADYED